jgi:hypothetical protein
MRRWMVAAIVACLALGAAAAWWAGWFGRGEDPRLTAVKEFQAELAAKYPPEQGPQSVVDAAERVAAFATVMGRINALPTELRPQAIEAGRRILMRSMQAKIDRYFTLPAAERLAFLDREIGEMELMRKAFETGRGLMQAVGLGGPAKDKSAGRAGPQARSEEDRNTWRKQIIDATHPEQRAKFSEYLRAVEVRRAALGLPPGGPR